MTKKEAIELLDKLETAISNGRTMIHTIQPFEDWAEPEKENTYEDGKHEGYLIGLKDGIEASMGMVEHFQDIIEMGLLKDFQFKEEV